MARWTAKIASVLNPYAHTHIAHKNTHSLAHKLQHMLVLCVQFILVVRVRVKFVPRALARAYTM